MITSENYTDTWVSENLLLTEEVWNDETDEYETVYANMQPLSDIKQALGIPLPNIQSVITQLYEGDQFLIAHFGNTEVFLQGDVGHETYEEAVVASIELTAWTELPDDEEAYIYLEVGARWAHEWNPASEAEGRRVLRWLYEWLQSEWENMFNTAVEEMGI